tara:strand:- start:3358 stop:4347 length:990 start_codon:yes stop_codon:yes gene_type:complete
MNVLLVGGGGYIGSVVAEYLSRYEEMQIYIVDNYIYENQIPINFKNKKIINLEISMENFFDSYDFKFDNVILFAGLVGDPITKTYPDLSLEINQNSIISFLNKIRSYSFDKLIFISTCSNYGLLQNDEIANENTILYPLSLYAKSKVLIEKKILDTNFRNFNKTILRFSTAFGLSKRMRFDLTINQFTYEAYNKKNLKIYDANTWRPYCHVIDFARAIKNIIFQNNKLINGEVFNIGSEDNNSTKKMLVDQIYENFTDFKVQYEKDGEDPRNYRVNFQKMRDLLNFEPKYKIDYGIREIISYLESNRIDDKKISQMGNFKIKKDIINKY